MNEINNRQVDETAKQFRYSFMCWYNKAKRINLAIIVISFIIALFSVINILYMFKLDKFLAFLGAFWIVISTVLKNVANNYKKIGADIQEEFDTYVFGLGKNSLLVMPKISIENIYAYTNKKENNTSNLYYTGLNSLNKMKNIIIAQRDNIVFDKNMRKTYYLGNIYALVIYLVIAFALGIMYEFKIEEFLASIIIPAINIVVYFTENILMIKNELEILREGELSIENLFLSASNNEDVVIDELTCREYQNFIYLKRRNWVMIPNYIYRMKQRYEKTRMIVNKQLSSN